MPDAIVMQDVRKTYGPKVAVERMDLAIPEGSLCGFIGPNGAGKTTTIRMIMSIIFPDAGRLSVLGRASALDSKDRIGYLPEERGVYRKMRVASFLRYLGRLKRVESDQLEKRIGHWLERVGLGDVAKKRCEELSKGMQQKVQFIGAVIHDPELIILDEPFSGLDPVNMRLLRDLLLEMHGRGKTVLFSTHVMHQAEQLCDRVVMITRGQKVLDASMDDIRRRFDPHSLLVEPLDPNADAGPLRAAPGVTSVERPTGGGSAAGEWTVRVSAGFDPNDAMKGLLAAMPLRRVEIKRVTLEEVFVELVGVSPSEEGAAHEEHGAASVAGGAS